MINIEHYILSTETSNDFNLVITKVSTWERLVGVKIRTPGLGIQ